MIQDVKAKINELLLQLTQLKGSQVTFGEKWYIYRVAFVLISNYLIFFFNSKI